LWEVEEKEEPINADLEESDPIFILYTSGTTGFPKGAIYTHGMMFWNSVNTALALNLNQDSSTINCMPFFHTGGWNVLTTPMLHHGAKVYLSKKFDPSVIIDVIETKDITIFMGVPTMLKMMSEEPAFKEAEFASLLYILVGGEPMELAQIDLWHQKGVPIRQGYGMTEAGPNLTSLHHDDAVIKMGSIGRSNFYVQYKIVDDQGQVVDPDVPGELLLRGPIVTPGYWKNEKANADAFEEGWFKTGDRVLEDQDGYLFVVDRIKNMYISGGENVYPAEVERVIMEVDGVEEVAVIGVPNIKWGESGKAFYVSSHHVEVDEIISHCKSKLAKFKVPSEFQVLPSLPKTDTGKIDRGRLKELSKKKPARE
jgi:fatty-acyl-CoA synthase